MPATVKSLEERIDGMADDVAQIKIQTAALATKVEIVGDEVKGTRLKVDNLAADYTAFKSKAETTFALVRWIGVFTAGVFVTVILGAFTVARSAGSLEATIQQQQKTLDEIRRDVAELHGKQK
ncbi:MAG: hypothetical protein J2P46_10620 [Zavarzinella sp.]|nr:hypothetical protein [Zavarzinella sp.]